MCDLCGKNRKTVTVQQLLESGSEMELKPIELEVCIDCKEYLENLKGENK